MKRLTVKVIATAGLFFVFLVPRTSYAQDRGPSTPAERARAVKVAHELEQDPLAKDASSDRTWVIQWIKDIPDITVSVCFLYFGEHENPARHAQDIAWQMVISSTAFMIEHPDKAKDDQAVALAGLLGALKTYQAIIKQEPAARWSLVDNLIQMRDQGKLDDYVGDTRRKCSQEEEDKDPNRMRAQAEIR